MLLARMDMGMEATMGMYLDMLIDKELNRYH